MCKKCNLFARNTKIKVYICDAPKGSGGAADIQNLFRPRGYNNSRIPYLTQRMRNFFCTPEGLSEPSELAEKPGIRRIGLFIKWCFQRLRPLKKTQSPKANCPKPMQQGSAGKPKKCEQRPNLTTHDLTSGAASGVTTSRG